MRNLTFLSCLFSTYAWRGGLSYRDQKSYHRKSTMISLALVMLGFVLGLQLGAPSPLAADDCDILKNQCGATKDINVKGVIFAGAVKQASQSHGKQPWKKIKGNCDVYNKGHGVSLPLVVASAQKCEIKLLTGGKSHSKMKKKCAIKKWVKNKSFSNKDGLGGSWSVKILKKPQNNTRQKTWRVKLKSNRPSPAPQMFFSISSVKLKIPVSSSLKNSSSSNSIRDYCFQ